MKVLLITFFTLVSSQLMAKEVVGRVSKLRGQVLRSNDKENIQEEPIKAGSDIYLGDHLKSDKSSFAKILMKDDTIFSLGAQTEFAFESFAMKDKNDRSATYNLIRGKLRSVFTRKAPTRSLKITTPVASMAVRGTEIVSDVYKAGEEIRADIGLISGKLEVHSRGQIIELQPQDLFEASKSLDTKRGPAATNFNKRKIEDGIFARLKASPSRGGHTFLFDALKNKRRDLNKKARFDFIAPATYQKNKLEKAGDKNRAPASVKEKIKENTQKRFAPPRDMVINDKSREHVRKRLRRPPPPMLKPIVCPVGTVMMGGICRPKLDEPLKTTEDPNNLTGAGDIK